MIEYLDNPDDTTIRVFDWHTKNCFMTEFLALVDWRIEPAVFVRVDDVHNLGRKRERRKNRHERRRLEQIVFIRNGYLSSGGDIAGDANVDWKTIFIHSKMVKKKIN